MNRILLMASLAQTPELTATPSGVPIWSATLAGERTVTAKDGSLKQIPFYVQVQRLGDFAEALAARGWVGGDVVILEGQLDYSQWENESGKQNMIRAKLTGTARQVDGDFELVTDAAGGTRLKGGRNEVSLIGNLSADAELKHTDSGDAVVDLRLAVNETWKDKAGNAKEKVHWVTVTVWRELAEQCQGFKKGDPVLIEGALIDAPWTDKDGNKRRQQKVEASFVARLKKGAGTGAPTRELVGAAAAPRSQASSTAAPETDLPF